MIQIIKGNFIEAKSLTELCIREKSYALIEDGILTGFYEALPAAYEKEPVEDYQDALILQPFSDMHLHGPQYEMIGTGMDIPLLDWLERYAFPTESRYEDTAHARVKYKKLAEDLVHSGTNRVAMFSSLHLESTLILMEELEKQGIEGYVGKVNMDSHAPAYLCETAEQSLQDTVRFVEEAKRRFRHIKPILTPRFAPSCSKELLAGLGRIKQDYKLPVQSHLSENHGEIQLVKTLFPDCGEYWQVYDKFGLWDSQTLMAHCVHSSPTERRAMKQAGVKIVHCADSNNSLLSGICPVCKDLEEGLELYLGSDVAGGCSLSMLSVMAQSIRASKDRAIASKGKETFLQIPAAYYLATSAAAPFFGRKPGFAMGEPFEGVVVDDTSLGLWAGLSLDTRLGRCIMCCDDRHIKSLFTRGRKVF